MNNSSSRTRKQKKPLSTPLTNTSKIQSKGQQQKEKRCSRDPNGDIKNQITCDASVSTSSFEAPKGCLRFFLSHSSSVKTPKSAPVVRPTINTNNRYKAVALEAANVKHSCLHKWHSGEKPTSKNLPSTKLSSDSEPDPDPDLVNNKMQRKEDRYFNFNAADLTPLSKVGGVSDLGCVIEDEIVVNDGCEKSGSANCKTPPVQASVSPEIQCGSSIMSKAACSTTTTPACYGAGHLLSGVGDKRKCKPRGILTVREGKALASLGSDDDDDGQDEFSVKANVIRGDPNSCVSLLPLPAHASVHWFLSPSNEKDRNQKGILSNGSGHFQRWDKCATLNSSASPSSGNGLHLDLCENTTRRGISTTSSRRGRNAISLNCPNLLFPFQESVGSPVRDDLTISPSEEKNKNCVDIDSEQSPFSTDSLDYKNVIQTPESGCSSDTQAGMVRLSTPSLEDMHNCDSKLSSVSELLHSSDLSPASNSSTKDIANSSFQFNHLTTPSNSVDLSKFQKFVEDRASWFSNSMPENASQSHVRISWREGLMSRVFEMDEFDSCRCLSDDEDGHSGCKDDQQKYPRIPKVDIDVVDDQVSTTGFESTEFVNMGSGINEEAKRGVVRQVTCPCAESISTDGDALVRSEDSDWTLFYKNHLFQFVVASTTLKFQAVGLEMASFTEDSDILMVGRR